MICLKIVLPSSEVRKIKLESFSFLSLVGVVKNLSTLRSFDIQYKDDENDLITIGSDTELEEAFQISRKDRMVRLAVVERFTDEGSESDDEKSYSASKDVVDASDLGVTKAVFGSNSEPSISVVHSSLLASVSASTTLLQQAQALLEIAKDIRTKDAKSSQPSTHQTQDSFVLHDGIVCFSCAVGISGIRYKCAMCTSLDLCSECFSGHDSSHPLIMLRQPSLPLADFRPYKLTVQNPAFPVLSRNFPEANDDDETPGNPQAKSIWKQKLQLRGQPSDPSFSHIADPLSPKFEELVRMGFSNRSRNLEALNRFDGDINRCVQWLLEC